MSKLSEWLNLVSHPNAPKPPSPLESSKPAPAIPVHPDTFPAVSEEELDAGKGAVRALVDESGYGGFVSDGQCLGMATKVLVAAAKVRHPSLADKRSEKERDEA